MHPAQQDGEFAYRVFISYSHADDRWARWLHRALERYRPPKSLAGEVPSSNGKPHRISPVFRDREELPSATSLSEAVNQALQQSENLVVICSPAAAQSRWVNEEIIAFRELGRSDRIFCFIVDGEPFSGDQRECIPQALRFEWSEREGLTNVPAEPLAADARPVGDGKTLARLKLTAGLLGVKYDSLRQRDLQRRYHRMLAVTSGALGIAVLTISLAVSAYLSNNEAERRRAQAEGLIGFLVEDLYNGLHEIGRLDVFMSVGNKAMEYFAELADEDVDNTVLLQRATVLQQIGNTRLDQGAMDAALESFTDALAIAQRLAEADPTVAEWQISLANSHFWVGYVHWQRGQLAEAGASFEQVIPIVDAVAEQHPGEAEWLVERSYAYTNLARVLELQGRLQASLQWYESIADINRQLLTLEPDNIDYQLEVGFAHNNLGKMYQLLCRLVEAEAHFIADLEIKRAIQATDANHNLWRDYLANSLVYYARYQVMRGELDPARQLYSEALSIIRQLNAIEPEQTDWLDNLAAYELELAALEHRQGRPAAAQARLGRALTTWQDLLKLDDSRIPWQSGVGRALILDARWALADGRIPHAMQQSGAAQQIFASLLTADNSNLDSTRDGVLATLVRGDVLQQAGDIPAAQIQWQRALEQVQTSVVIEVNPEHMDLHGRLLRRLGQPAEATRIRAELDAMGYHSLLD